MALEEWPISLRQDGPVSRARAAIRCLKCGDSADVAANIKGASEWRSGNCSNTDWFVKNFAKKGWINPHGGVGTCPKCANIGKIKSKELKMHKSADVVIIKSQPRQEPSPSASKAIALLYMALDDQYDRVNKCYRQGYSDEKISVEVGLAVEVVRKRREEDFGPLAPKFDAAKVLDGLAAQSAKAIAAMSAVEGASVMDLSDRIGELLSAVKAIDSALRSAKSQMGG